MTDATTRASAAMPEGLRRWWRAIPLVAAAGVAVVAWRWPALIDARAGSVIATTLTVLALAAAIIAFLRATPLPWAARLIASALAAYGIAALLQGTLAGATLSEMVGGASVWQPLPRWLRGAFVGGCLVLPLAVVVQLVKTGLRGWRNPSSTAWRELNAAIVYALCAATAFSTWTPLRQAAQPVGSAAAFAVPAVPAPGAAGLITLKETRARRVVSLELFKCTDELSGRATRIWLEREARLKNAELGVMFAEGRLRPIEKSQRRAERQPHEENEEHCARHGRCPPGEPRLALGTLACRSRYLSRTMATDLSCGGLRLHGLRLSAQLYFDCGGLAA